MVVVVMLSVHQGASPSDRKSSYGLRGALRPRTPGSFAECYHQLRSACACWLLMPAVDA